MGSEEHKASRTDDTEKYMDAVYGDARTKDYNLRISEAEANDDIDKGYQKFDDFLKKHEGFVGDFDILANYGSVLDQTKAMYRNSLDRIDQTEAAMLVKASNKAAALNQGNTWSTIQADVAKIAKQQGINIDMEQAKGIYIIDASLDAEGVVARYKKQTKDYENLQIAQAQAPIAWGALANSYRNGVKATADEIN